jgi:hypothetical protein
VNVLLVEIKMVGNVSFESKLEVERFGIGNDHELENITVEKPSHRTAVYNKKSLFRGDGAIKPRISEALA